MTLLKKLGENGNEQVLIIADNSADWDVVKYLYDSHIVFGAFMLYHFSGDKSRTSNPAKFMQKNYPLAEGMLHINVVKGFVP
jgi:hypothetical protein